MEAQGEEGCKRRCKFMGALFEHSGRDVVRTGRLANVELVQEAFHCLQAEVDSGKWGDPGLASMREIPRAHVIISKATFIGEIGTKVVRFGSIHTELVTSVIHQAWYRGAVNGVSSKFEY